MSCMHACMRKHDIILYIPGLCITVVSSILLPNRVPISGLKARRYDGQGTIYFNVAILLGVGIFVIAVH